MHHSERVPASAASHVLGHLHITHIGLNCNWADKGEACAAGPGLLPSGGWAALQWQAIMYGEPLRCGDAVVPVSRYGAPGVHSGAAALWLARPPHQQLGLALQPSPTTRDGATTTTSCSRSIIPRPVSAQPRAETCRTVCACSVVGHDIVSIGAYSRSH